MTSWHKNPALYAGLAGAVSFAAPTYAHAVEIFGTNVPMSEVGFAFVGGCVSGALVASGVSIVTNYIIEARSERDAAAHMFENHAATAKAQADSQAQAQTKTRVSQAPAHAAQSAPAQTHGKRFKKAEPEFYGRHSAEARAVREWEQTGAIRIQSAGASHMAASTNASLTDEDAVLFNSVSNDYAEIADQYVQKMTLAERMSSRAKGVAGVLSERLGAGKMDGVPHIERAHGATAHQDISLWDSPLDELDSLVADYENRSYIEIAQEELDWSEAPTNPNAQRVSVSEQAQVAPDSTAQYLLAAQASQLLEDLHTQDAQAQPAAPRQVSTTPATQTKPEGYSAQQQDLWNVALSAMDERFAERIAMGPDAMSYDFKDDIGDIDTLDEPEGLEPVTTFMTFKPTAGHPEVQDTGSYIDLLIDQEFAQNESAAARKSVRGVMRNYLQVIEGTGALDAVRKAPKHMSAGMNPAPLAFAQ